MVEKVAVEQNNIDTQCAFPFLKKHRFDHFGKQRNVKLIVVQFEGTHHAVDQRLVNRDLHGDFFIQFSQYGFTGNHVHVLHLLADLKHSNQGCNQNGNEDAERRCDGNR